MYKMSSPHHDHGLHTSTMTVIINAAHITPCCPIYSLILASHSYSTLPNNVLICYSADLPVAMKCLVGKNWIIAVIQFNSSMKEMQSLTINVKFGGHCFPLILGSLGVGVKMTQSMISVHRFLMTLNRNVRLFFKL